MEPVLLLKKPLGWTPLACLQAWQDQHPDYRAVKLGYAGRLDPMAEGLLLVLVGEQNKHRSQFEALQKTYSFTMLWGVSTDTYDLLGLIEKTTSPSSHQLEQTLRSSLPSLLGRQLQAFPPFSSKPVLGKPLFWWARQGRVGEIMLPQKQIEIFSLTCLATRNVATSSLKATIEKKLTRVHGDFRQAAIREKWNEFFLKTPLTHLPVSELSLTCSSGTYVRALVNELGKTMGIPAVTMSISRTKIGPYSLDQALSLTE